LSAITLVVALSLTLASTPARAEDTVQALVLRSEELTDAEARFRVLHQAVLLNRRTHEIPRDKEQILRAYTIEAAARAVSGTMERRGEPAACRQTEELIRLIEPYEPAVKEVDAADTDGRFGYWAYLLVLSSVCHSNADDYGPAKVAFERAKPFEKARFPPDWKKPIRRIFDMAQSNLRAVDPYRTGNYLTDRGLFQDWIGRIVEAGERTVEVRFTYVREDGPYGGRRGRTATFAKKDVRALTAVSVDALMSGWR
jgi:hypothetical protein